MKKFPDMEQSFKEALKNKNFHVWYQPQVDMRTGRPKGAEALVRWRNEDGSLTSPDRFVPALEKLGLASLLDEEVMGIVCRDICEARSRGIPFGPVSVNLSRLHAGRSKITDKFRGITQRHGVGERELSFEITETAAQELEGKEMIRFVERLKGDGYRIAMDDYGMGNSTLRMLRDVRFDILKLDRYFVSRIGEPKSDIILSSTIGMAGALGMEVVAEGVETKEQISFLLEHECYFGQGYYYSRPLPKEEYIRWRQAYEETV